jgi:type II secretory ATPase GspE/PulE/Tfp pilus assembly ATPase PilB-like protein
MFRSLFRKRSQAIASKNHEIDGNGENAVPSPSPIHPEKDISMEEFLDYWLRKAIEMDASDIHFECYRSYVKIRYRIDGKLQTIRHLPINLHSGLIARIKILSQLKIDEKRLPQDGRFSLSHGNENFDIRVSILPGYLGECVVMRLLHSDGENFSLQKLGARDRDVQKLEDLASIQNGIIIIAGPTGSGKSTTLYSIVKKISSPDAKSSPWKIP